ncbi:MAG: hypothetical protein LBU53_09810 [Zoogloeaceae bacterium]|jgi:hypothetical protein|nr:hypothetical protein [Zoogloeaceae bacterium]
MTNKFISSLTSELAIEKDLMAEHDATPVAKRLTSTRENILYDLQTIGKSGNLETIVAAEKILVEKDLADHTNSKKMASSLNGAKEGLETIEAHIGMVGNPQEYQTINKTNQLQKMRDSHDLPRDGARQAFRSHATRLENLDAGRVSDIEKAIIQQRQKNNQIAEKEYIGRQEKALGREHKEPSRP